MQDSSLIGTLALITLVLAAGYGVWQLTRVRKSQEKRGEHPGGIAGPD
jgi:hypothetical protein